MELGNTTDVLILAASLLATGLVAGVLAGLIGVGGGIVIVPVLFQVFTALGIDPAVKMHLAVGTSLATIIPTSIRSVMAHNQKGAVDLDLLKSWAPAMLVGVLAGTYLAVKVSSLALTMVFAVVALIVAVHMAFGRENWALARHLPQGMAAQPLPFGIGAISAMMGIGGGTLGVPLLSLFKTPIHKAVGTASGFGLIISIPATIGFIVSGLNAENVPHQTWAFGYVSLLGFALIVPTTVIAAPWGVKIAHALSQTMLRRAFALFLAITSGRMFYDVLTRL